MDKYGEEIKQKTEEINENMKCASIKIDELNKIKTKHDDIELEKYATIKQQLDEVIKMMKDD